MGCAPPELVDLSPGWYLRWRALPAAVRGAMRTYTVRAARLGAPRPQLDVDVVLAEGNEHPGPGSSWVTGARTGDPVTLLGPNVHATSSAGIEWHPPAAAPDTPVRVLLAGDETAVPAISAILESLPAGYHGYAVLEVPCAADLEDLGCAADVEVQWLARNGRPHGQALVDAVRALLARQPWNRRVPAGPPRGVDVFDGEGDAEVLWDTPSFLGLRPEPVPEPSYAWVAGEAAMVRDLRRMLTQQGVDRGSLACMGYWRRGRSEPE